MKIYNTDGTEYLYIEVSDESYRYRELRGESYVQLEFALATYVELPLRSYIIIDDERYTLLEAAKIESEHSRSYVYTARYEAPQALLKLYRFRNSVDGRQKFPLTAKPAEHLQMLIANLAPRDAMWQMGDCIDAPEKVISYDYLTCYDALDLIAATFETEWEIVGGVISLHKVEYYRNEPLALAYGKDMGLLPGVGRSIFGSEKPISAVFPQGGERNIDPSKYGNKTLLLPKSKAIGYDGYRFSDELLYDSSKGVEYVTSPDGTSVGQYKPTNNIAEGTLDCTDIYPQRVGKVTSVVVRDASQNFYDICDDTIPDALNFEDYRIAGETMTIVFQSGMLAGREFSVSHYAHYAVGQLPAHRFEIAPQAYDGVVMPDEVYVPAVGDEYAIFGIALPDAYIADDNTKSGAEWDMFRKCVKHLYENEKQAYSFTGKLDPKFVKHHNIYDRVRVGAYISFTNDGFQPEPMLMRVASVKDYINAPHNIEININERAFTPTSHRKLIVSNARVNAGLAAALGESRRTEVNIKLLATDALGKADTAYQKPTTGIPKNDLAQEVQSSLYNADASVGAIQSLQRQITNNARELSSFAGIVEQRFENAEESAAELRAQVNANSERLAAVEASSNVQLPEVRIAENGGRSYSIDSGVATVFTTALTEGANFLLRTDIVDGVDNVWVIRFGIGTSNTKEYAILSDNEIYSFKWANGIAPTFENGKYYELSFRLIGQKFLGTWTSFGN